MVSGIGEQKELDKHHIKCIHSLHGVGKNLQDHIFFPIGSKAKEQLGSTIISLYYNNLKLHGTILYTEKVFSVMVPLRVWLF